MIQFALIILMMALGFPAEPGGSSRRPEGAGTLPRLGSQVIGPEVCTTCHEDLTNAFKTNVHAKSCETCHGSAQEHAESADISKIRSFKILTPTKSTAVCLDCHRNDKTHSNRLFDAHSKNNVSCNSCHSVHKGAQRTSLLAKPTTELCATCHAAERAHFNRPFGHKVAAGMMDCVSCHAPHGGSPALKIQMAASHSNDMACLSCHGDKRGPFAFEHMPVKVEGCSGCHEPHGSANPRMLIRSEVRQLCLECHTNSKTAFGKTPPAFHDLRSERFRNCTTCHTKIHGSHTSPAFLR
jgi:DmsE family decaheme c-type cytochrome